MNARIPIAPSSRLAPLALLCLCACSTEPAPVTLSEPACVDDPDCAAEAPFCTNDGSCVACLNDFDCVEARCSPEGSCVACRADSDCPSRAPFCSPSYSCAQCRSEADCPGVAQCLTRGGTQLCRIPSGLGEPCAEPLAVCVSEGASCWPEWGGPGAACRVLCSEAAPVCPEREECSLVLGIYGDEGHPGVCAPPVGEGAACDDRSLFCGAGLGCQGGTCIRLCSLPADLSGTGTGGVPCPGGGQCEQPDRNSPGLCRPATDAACGPDDSCMSGERCVPEADGTRRCRLMCLMVDCPAGRVCREVEGEGSLCLP